MFNLEAVEQNIINWILWVFDASCTLQPVILGSVWAVDTAWIKILHRLSLVSLSSYYYPEFVTSRGGAGFLNARHQRLANAWCLVCLFGMYPRNSPLERDGICREEAETQLTFDWKSQLSESNLPTERNSNIHLEDVLGTEVLNGNGKKYVQAVQVGKRRQDWKVCQDMVTLTTVNALGRIHDLWKHLPSAFNTGYPIYLDLI